MFLILSALEGFGIELITLLQLALSVMNQLLMSWPEGTSTSPVAQMLSSRPTHGAERHIVATVSHYIYHRHNPDLPSQATLLLKHLALVSCGYLARVYGGNTKVLTKDFSYDYCFIIHLVLRYYDYI